MFKAALNTDNNYLDYLLRDNCVQSRTAWAIGRHSQLTSSCTETSYDVLNVILYW